MLEQGGQFAGINRKVQLKPLQWSTPEEGSDEAPRCLEALLILKHGGVLTHAGQCAGPPSPPSAPGTTRPWACFSRRARSEDLGWRCPMPMTDPPPRPAPLPPAAGRQQAEALGSLFRNIMYPQTGPTGGGLLRLHSTYRHDLKIYSSDEGRVQTSAAAFTKGLLDLEGAALTPILVSLVKKVGESEGGALGEPSWRRAGPSAMLLPGYLAGWLAGWPAVQLAA